MFVLGHVHDGVVIPDEPADLPEGASVRIELLAGQREAFRLPPRTGGIWHGKVTIADDFDELPRDIAEAFGIGSP